MTTPIRFDVLIDSSTTDGLIINGINIPISTNGTFGPDFLGEAESGGNYTVIFRLEEVRIETRFIMDLGQAAPCFISGTLIN